MMRPTPAPTSPTASVATPSHSTPMKPFGFCGSRPMADGKNPADLRMADHSTKSPRVRDQSGTRGSVSSSRMTRPSVTRTPAWACPARKKDFCRSLAGKPPEKTRSRKVPPKAMVG